MRSQMSPHDIFCLRKKLSKFHFIKFHQVTHKLKTKKTLRGSELTSRESPGQQNMTNDNQTKLRDHILN